MRIVQNILIAPENAVKAEALMRDFCYHLLSAPNTCIVTTTELQDPNWKPPFKNGIILLNLCGHFDEATPGVHVTLIPYASGYKTGANARASMVRAFTAMGYPSSWVEVLDENGQPIPKRDRKGKIIKEKNGSIRTKKRPEGKGILDWVEDQKGWLAKEMEERYDWRRLYKGAHPRGNLSTPDYKAVRAADRLQHLEEQASQRKNSVKEWEERSIQIQNNMKELQDQSSMITGEISQQILTKAELEQDIQGWQEANQALLDLWECNYRQMNQAAEKLRAQHEQRQANLSNQELLQWYLRACPDDVYQDLLASAAKQMSLENAVQTRALDLLLVRTKQTHFKETPRQAPAGPSFPG